MDKNKKNKITQETNQLINDGKLSPEQIKNWRKVLVMQVGSYAFIMPDSEVGVMWLC